MTAWARKPPGVNNMPKIPKRTLFPFYDPNNIFLPSRHIQDS